MATKLKGDKFDLNAFGMNEVRENTHAIFNDQQVMYEMIKSVNNILLTEIKPKVHAYGDIFLPQGITVKSKCDDFKPKVTSQFKASGRLVAGRFIFWRKITALASPHMILEYPR